MKICVLQPDYSTSAVDYQHYDPSRKLSHLLPAHTVDHVALNKLTTYKQLKALSRKGYDIFVNLCEGYLEWEVPSIDVIHSLELLKLPYTGPTPLLYDPPKTLMKYVAHTANVRTPAYALIERTENSSESSTGDSTPVLNAENTENHTVANLHSTLNADLSNVASRLKFPLFVKPAKAGDSLGVDEHSLIHDVDELRSKVAASIDEFPELLIEEYIDGREFTVLVLGNIDGRGHPRALTPVEFIFPSGNAFKTYALKTSELHPEANIPVRDEKLSAELRAAAERVFMGFGGVGYARLDFRQNAQGELFFLEINFTCSVFYADGYEGSADYILKHDGMGQTAFAEHIIAEGIARHRRAQKPFAVRGNSLAGFGIHATRPIAVGEVVFAGEERAHRITTRRHVNRTWNAEDQLMFRQYAYPISDQVFALWDTDPSEWAPQNHSCSPNTAYDGLNVVAIRAIAAGEELTLDYAQLTNAESEPFDCHCGAANCRGRIVGAGGNSVTARENARLRAN